MEISSLRTSTKLYVHEFGFRRKLSLLFVLCIKKYVDISPLVFITLSHVSLFLFTYYAKSAEITHIWRGTVNKAKRGVHSESIATVPPFGPIEGHNWFDQFSSQSESQKNRFALIDFGKIQFLPPCIWNLPFMSYRLRGSLRDVVYLGWPIGALVCEREIREKATGFFFGLGVAGYHWLCICIAVSLGVLLS
jgi:hypothetical protein